MTQIIIGWVLGKFSFVCFCLVIFITIVIKPQNISELSVAGKGELQPQELIGQENKDKNGEICAGLMIFTDMDGLSYDSNNGIVKVSNNPGRDLLFLSPTERVVTVFKTGYKPLKLILNEHGIRLKSGEVWKVEITGEKKLDLIPVNILVNQEADVFINDISKGKVKLINLTAGKYKLRLEKEGYSTIEKDIEVSSINNLFTFEMQVTDPEKVEITSQPSGARIFIGSVEKGETNKQMWLNAGKYKIRLQKSGYIEINEEIEVKQNRQNKFNYTLNKNAGSLMLTVFPVDAEVYINKEKVVENQIDLPPGTYKLEIIKDGYGKLEDAITIKLGEPIKKTFTLKPITGSLQFSVEPYSANITLERNGQKIEEWEGLKILKNLKVGKYILKAILPGYETKITEIEISEDRNTIVDITLKQNTIAETNKTTNNNKCGTPLIYSGKTYNTIQIGNQCWLKENLDIGTMIQNDQNQINNGVIEKYCYDNNPENCEKYGGLYQWDEAMQYNKKEGTKGICPNGWHIPTKGEYLVLKSYVNNSKDALLAHSQSTGKDTYGFSTLLAGVRYNHGVFCNLGYNTDFWSSTEFNTIYAYNMSLGYDDSNVSLGSSGKTTGFSIRCLKDN